VTISAVVVILGSLIALLAGVLTFAARAFQASQTASPAFVRTSLALTGVMMLLLSLWGIATAIGLFRLRVWSRTSILIFSGLLTLCCGTTVLIVNVMPMPGLPADARVHVQMSGIMLGISVFYGLLAMLGGFWLYFFNSAKVKAQFAGVAGGELTGTNDARPVSVTIIAAALLFSGVTFVLLGFAPLPATVFGTLVAGWPGHIVNIGLGGVALWLGIGLLRLNPLDRSIAIWILAYFVLNCLLFVVLPGSAQRMNASLMALPAEFRQTQVGDYTRMVTVAMLPSALLYVLAVWFLWKNRPAFLANGSGSASTQNPQVG
jgi:hypothetical protein